MWEPRRLTTLWASDAGIALAYITLSFIEIGLVLWFLLKDVSDDTFCGLFYDAVNISVT
jgi:hypothetical protein